MDGVCDTYFAADIQSRQVIHTYIHTVQYSQTNPNPKIVMYIRKYLHEAVTITKNESQPLPI
jgi:hypothetical protein